MWYIHTTEFQTMASGANACYNVDEPWKYYAKWKKSVTKYHIVWFYLYEMSRIGKSIETECRLMVPWGQGPRVEWGMTANEYGVYFQIIKMF